MEPDLTKEQLSSVLQNYFKSPQNQGKTQKKEKTNIPLLSYIEVLNCLVQYQAKAAGQGLKERDGSS